MWSVGGTTFGVVVHLADDVKYSFADLKYSVDSTNTEANFFFFFFFFFGEGGGVVVLFCFVFLFSLSRGFRDVLR